VFALRFILMIGIGLGAAALLLLGLREVAAPVSPAVYRLETVRSAPATAVPSPVAAPEQKSMEQLSTEFHDTAQHLQRILSAEGPPKVRPAEANLK